MPKSVERARGSTCRNAWKTVILKKYEITVENLTKVVKDMHGVAVLSLSGWKFEVINDLFRFFEMKKNTDPYTIL